MITYCSSSPLLPPPPAFLPVSFLFLPHFSFFYTALGFGLRFFALNPLLFFFAMTLKETFSLRGDGLEKALSHLSERLISTHLDLGEP